MYFVLDSRWELLWIKYTTEAFRKKVDFLTWKTKVKRKQKIPPGSNLEKCQVSYCHQEAVADCDEVTEDTVFSTFENRKCR